MSGSNRQKAVQASVRSRVERKHEVLEEVADYLEATPQLRYAKPREIADKLNEAGIFTGWNRLWTPGSVRGAWRAIAAELDFRLAVAAEDAADAQDVACDLTTAASPSSTATSSTESPAPSLGATGTGSRPSPASVSQPSRAPASERTCAPVSPERQVDARGVSAEDFDKEIGMRKLPYLDMFGTRE